MAVLTSSQISSAVHPEPRKSAAFFAAQSGIPVVLSRKGLQLPRQCSFDNWLIIGEQLSAISSSSRWCLGDWLFYGEKAYSGRYREAIEQTSLDYQTLRNYAWVARRFVMSRRRDTLTFAHHAEVAALSEPEQDFWLRKAEDLEWSRNRLRREVRASLRERSQIGEPGQPSLAPREDDPKASLSRAGRAEHRIQIYISPEQLEVCRNAAARLGLSIEVWAIQALDQVARYELSATDL